MIGLAVAVMKVTAKSDTSRDTNLGMIQDL
jgi:hypothetical protein